ncbi:MAG: Rrf2 family transcriptional regulator [Candidatus Pacebacteria bacterium]|nr:Rrf2 family transcriptional regulator [Candidatus Paceibacterota bacterium]
MKISKKTQYGLRALVFLAKNGFSSIKRIAQAENIPYYYLEKIFSDLENSGLVKSKKGSLGGYFLKKKKIKLNDIFEALGEKMILVDCLKQKCCQEKTCLTKSIWQNLYQKQKQYIDSISLTDLIK